MGASTAYHLAKLGVKDVVLLEKEDFFGQGATGRCAGGVRTNFPEITKLSANIPSRVQG
jgi:sarcosine oxidase subunit beta